MFDYDAWVQWFESLDRTLLFIVVLSFVVIVVGLWNKHANSRKNTREGSE